MTWLLNRLFDHQHQPTPRFAFQGTVNWMRALAILIEYNDDFESDSLSDFYSSVPRRPKNPEADTLAFDCLLMALHNVSSLQEFKKYDNKYAIVRSAIVAWYYSLYYSSKAMLAAIDGSDSQTHAKAGRILQSEVVDKNLFLSPFSLSITNITTKNVTDIISNLRGQNNFDLNTTPSTKDEAYGAAISYLKGTAEYEKWRTEEKVRNSKAFKLLNVNNFRKKVARELRDSALAKGHVNILVQAFRYRGKANYRDSIYLSYGNDHEDTINQFIQDLETVSKAYVYMISHYIPRRTEHGIWSQFTEDLQSKSRFELPFDIKNI